MSLPRVSICGLGAMGIGMARNLLKHGFKVSGYDIVPALVERSVQSGATAAASPKTAAENTDILLVIVVNSTQVSSVLFGEDTGAIHGLKMDAAIIISSTVPGSYVREVRRRLDTEFARPDIRLLDCPVSGGASGAADGTLTVFACGTDGGMFFIDPVLQSFSSKIYRIMNRDGYFGDTGSGANGKVCHQVIPEIAIALVAEILALAVRAGLNTREVYDYIQASEAASWIMRNRAPHALEGDETVYSAMTNSQKDSSIIVRSAAEKSFPVPLVAMAEQVYQTAVYIGWPGMDDSALWRLFLRESPADAVCRQTEIHNGEQKPAFELQDIVDIMNGVHLAATAESKGFTEAMGLNAEQMYEIVCGAAGWNVQFEQFGPRINKGPWYLQEIPEAKQIGLNLVSTNDSFTLGGIPDTHGFFRPRQSQGLVLSVHPYLSQEQQFKYFGCS